MSASIGAREATLTEFLLERIAEDEEALRSLEERVASSPGSYVSLGLDHPELAMGDCPGWIGEYDLARAHAECEAKRRIVAYYADMERREDNRDYDDGFHGMMVSFEDCVLPTLALLYDAHPDYREEWRVA